MLFFVMKHYQKNKVKHSTQYGVTFMSMDMQFHSTAERELTRVKSLSLKKNPCYHQIKVTLKMFLKSGFIEKNTNLESF